MGFNTDLADALKDSKSLRAEWYRLQHNDLRTAYDKLLVQAESLIQQIKQVRCGWVGQISLHGSCQQHPIC